MTANSFNSFIRGLEEDQPGGFKSFIDLAKSMSPSNPENQDSVNNLITESESILNKFEEKQEEKKEQEKIEENSLYKINKERTENFECKVSIEGSSLKSAKARLIIDSAEWSYLLEGTLEKDGRCSIPIKKGMPLLEGDQGNIKLEILIDDQIFTAWESEYLVEAHKKIKVDILGSKSIKVDIL